MKGKKKRKKKKDRIKEKEEISKMKISDFSNRRAFKNISRSISLFLENKRETEIWLSAEKTKK